MTTEPLLPCWRCGRVPIRVNMGQIHTMCSKCSGVFLGEEWETNARRAHELTELLKEWLSEPMYNDGAKKLSEKTWVAIK